MEARKWFKEAMSRPGYVIAPGAHDTLTAKLVEIAGFGAVYLTGGGYSRANGYPDIGLLSFTEVVLYIGRTVEAVGIPVITDMDSGFGNAINVVRAVREYEKAGVAAFHLEDQVSPKKCGHYDGKLLVSKAEMVGKIRAAVDTRQDPDMTIIGRTDAIAVEGFESAMDRMGAYLEAGADMAFVEAPRTVEELAAVPPRLAKPALANVFEGGKTPQLPAKQLEAMGYRLGIYPSQTHRASIFAAKEVLEVLKREGTTESYEHRLATFQQREEAVGSARWKAIEDKYLRSV